MRCARGLEPKRGKGAPQNLEEQDLEEKLHHVGVYFFCFVFFVFFLFQARRTNPSLFLKGMGAAEVRRAKLFYYTLFRMLIRIPTWGAPVLPDLESRPWAG